MMIQKNVESFLQKSLLLVAGLLLVLGSGCAHLGMQEAEPVNEAQVLLDFFENQRDYIYDGPPFVITAQALRTNLLTRPDEQYLIDVRSAEAFEKGHIKGSVHVDLRDVYKHIQNIDAGAYEKIVLICFAGQATAYQASLLHAAGYENVVSLKYGISSWHHVFAEESWLKHISSARIPEFVHTESPPKNPRGKLPELSTGHTNPEK
ncbi:MAG: rhodanese-like domain-containing protein, partial [Desulfovibrionales bacterium]